MFSMGSISDTNVKRIKSRGKPGRTDKALEWNRLESRVEERATSLASTPFPQTNASLEKHDCSLPKSLSTAVRDLPRTIEAQPQTT